jgi:hypothetical protein
MEYLPLSWVLILVVIGAIPHCLRTDCANSRGKFSKPLGVRLDGDGFKSEFAAKLAGEKALRDLLDGLAQEENL